MPITWRAHSICLAASEMGVITAHFPHNCWVISLKLTHDWWTVSTAHSLITALYCHSWNQEMQEPRKRSAPVELWLSSQLERLQLWLCLPPNIQPQCPVPCLCSSLFLGLQSWVHVQRWTLKISCAGNNRSTHPLGAVREEGVQSSLVSRLCWMWSLSLAQDPMWAMNTCKYRFCTWTNAEKKQNQNSLGQCYLFYIRVSEPWGKYRCSLLILPLCWFVSEVYLRKNKFYFVLPVCDCCCLELICLGSLCKDPVVWF